MKLCLIVVTYNREETLKKTLALIGKQNFTIDHIVVVNNASKDETRQFLNSFQQFKIDVLHLDTNLGFGYGLSAGMKFSLAI